MNNPDDTALNGVCDDTSHGHQYWQQRRGKIFSQKGKWRIGTGVISHGYDLMKEVAGRYSYMQVIILNATGRMPSKTFADWCEAAFICVSWPDARVWCNRIGALGGSAGASVVAASCAGILSSDSRMFGPLTVLKTMSFLQEAHKITQNDINHVVEFLAGDINARHGRHDFMGFTRPLTKEDERVFTLSAITEALGLKTGKYVALAKAIESYLYERYGDKMNAGGYFAAVLLDQGYTPNEAYRIKTCIVASGVTACYADAADKPWGSFRPLAAGDIQYTGMQARAIPSASVATTPCNSRSR